MTWKVYISSPIEFCTYSEVWNTREKIKKLLGEEHVVDVAYSDIQCVNKFGNKTDAENLVNYDLDRLSECDVVLCDPWKSSIGVSMEMVYAKGNIEWNGERHINTPIPVVTIVEDKNNCHPWLRYHSTVLVESVQEGVEVVKALMKKKYGEV